MVWAIESSSGSKSTRVVLLPAVDVDRPGFALREVHFGVALFVGEDDRVEGLLTGIATVGIRESRPVMVRSTAQRPVVDGLGGTASIEVARSRRIARRGVSGHRSGPQ
jgi:hypothetical protein